MILKPTRPSQPPRAGIFRLYDGALFGYIRLTFAAKAARRRMDDKRNYDIGILCRRPVPAVLGAVAESFRRQGISSAFLSAPAGNCDLIIAASPYESGLPPSSTRPPVLFYVPASPPLDLERLDLSARDDFLIAPAPLSEIMFRARRLIDRSSRTCTAIEQAKKTLLEEASLSGLIGTDPVFRAHVDKLPRLGACDVPVLLAGETGTGKEMFARALHYLSTRADGPFVPVNCGAVPADLFENKFFGHERGAFTGADTPRTGVIAQAEQGTLFRFANPDSFTLRSLFHRSASVTHHSCTWETKKRSSSYSAVSAALRHFRLTTRDTSNNNAAHINSDTVPGSGA